MATSTITYSSANNRQTVMVDTEKTAIPIALGIYTAISFEQQQQEADRIRQFDLKQAEELRQQTLYDNFLKDIYNLDKDGHLEEEDNPWAFANAYHRAADRQWDMQRKGDVLQFLKEKQLIGRNSKSADKKLDDIIRLNELNFDNIHLTSQTNSLNRMNLDNVTFDHVSMVNARFSFVNLSETSFYMARLNYAKFHDSSLAYATFDGTLLQGTDFGNSNLTGVRFLNVDLSTAILTQEQIQQAIFINTIMPNGTLIRSTTTVAPSTITTEKTVNTTHHDLRTSIDTISNSTTTSLTTDIEATTFVSLNGTTTPSDRNQTLATNSTDGSVLDLGTSIDTIRNTTTTPLTTDAEATKLVSTNETPMPSEENQTVEPNSTDF